MEVILDIEVKLSVMEPYSFEDPMLEFWMTVKKRNWDHASHITRVWPREIREISCKWKYTKAKFESYNNCCDVPSTKRGSYPKKLKGGKWTE